jgi:anti-sigma B factor antagonist
MYLAQQDRFMPSLLAVKTVFRFWPKTKRLPLDGEIQAKWEHSGLECQANLCGRITVDSSPDLHEVLEEKLGDSTCETLTLDFEGVVYMDTSGLAMLAELLKYAREQGKTFRIQRLRGRPRFLLEAAQLSRLFNLDTASEVES